MPKIEHFDIPADNIQRAKKFYENLFSWKIDRMPGDMEYYSVTTEEGTLTAVLDKDRRIKKLITT